MRRRAIFERVDKSRRNRSIDLGARHSRRVSNALYHQSRADWLRIAPDDKFDAVADDVVLPRLDRQRVLRVSSASSSHLAASRRGCGLKSIFLALLIIFVDIGKSTIQAEEQRLSGVDQAELLADRACAQGPGELGRLRFLAGGEEQAIIGAKAQRSVDFRHALWPMVLGDRPAEFAALARDVAKPGMAFGSAPNRSSRRRTCGSCRRSRAQGWRGRRHHSPTMLLEQAEARGA